VRGARRKKHFPPPSQVTREPGRDPEQPLVLGGSLTRSPEGRLQTLQTHGMYPSPQGVQEVWSSATRRRYPKGWEGKPLESVGHVIEWEPRAIACGACGHSLGTYVAYRARRSDDRARGEQGVVEDTSRRYEQQANLTRGSGARRPRPHARFWLEGEIGRRAAKTTACFRCSGCHREYRRNLSRLGGQLFQHPSGEIFLLD
jgi:hypothetical protein